jgi:hypothetical protein
LVALAGAVTGCIDPKKDYDDFLTRPLAQVEAGVVDVQLTPCQELLAQDLTGLYYTTCMPKALPAPFALAVNQQFSTTADGAKLDFSFKPIKKDSLNLDDTVGDTIVLPSTSVNADCTYTETIGELVLPGPSNSLGFDLKAENVILRGKIQSLDRACGELDGNVPLINLSLEDDGDACLFYRIPKGQNAPMVMPTDFVCDTTLLPPRTKTAP